MSTSACTWIEREEIFERYVRGALADAERDAFEAHYFECAACLAALQAYKALHAALRASPAPAGDRVAPPVPRRSWRWAIVPLAASAVLVAAVVWYWSSVPAPTTPFGSTETAASLRPAAPVAQPPASVSAPAAPPVSSPAVPRSSPPAAPPESPAVPLAVLARVEPPLYAPLALRGARDGATETFDAAMRLYVTGDYAGALPGLRKAAGTKPDEVQYVFFLAVCQLLTGDASGAAVGLRQTIALGESPFLEEAHILLAKAFLQQRQIPAARDQLRRAIDRHGRLEPVARRLLGQLESLPAGGRDRPPNH
jgi:hypothetical protein